MKDEYKNLMPDRFMDIMNRDKKTAKTAQQAPALLDTIQRQNNSVRYSPSEMEDMKSETLQGEASFQAEGALSAQEMSALDLLETHAASGYKSETADQLLYRMIDQMNTPEKKRQFFDEVQRRRIIEDENELNILRGEM